MEPTEPTRRSFAGALGTAFAFAIGSEIANAQERVAGFQPARHPQDAWLDTLPGRHRTVIDASTVGGAGAAMLYAYNLYAANKSDYALSERDVAVVVCLRHGGTAFAFTDAMWGKYAKSMNTTAQLVDPKTKEAPRTNLYYSVDYGVALTNFGATIVDLVKLGTHFAVCGMATRGLAASIATDTGGNADMVYAELVANTIPNSHMVAAGVLAVNRAQEHGYTLLTAL